MTKVSSIDQIMNSQKTPQTVYQSWGSYAFIVYIYALSSVINTLRLGQDGRHFGRRHFQMQICQWKYFNSIKISLKFVPKGPINNMPALV